MSTKNSNVLYMATLSDIHLGHRRNKAEDIIRNLRAIFPDNAETAELDIIFLAGDVFDDLLLLNNEDVLEIDAWIASFLRICKKHDIKVRVLEGTPSHDWRQSNRFSIINDRLGDIGADLIYVTELTIRYEEALGISVLFVPDEWENETEKTLSQVKDLLKSKGLEKVDYAIMHGQFDFQLPSFIKAPKHNSEEYLKLVRHLIFIGHVHKFSRKDRIIAQGSTDRLGHGEEEPKGHVRARVYSDGAHEITFIENVGAKKFVTVNCLGLTIEETLKRIDEVALPLPEGSYVRVEGEVANPIFENFNLLITRYPLFTWSKLVREEADKEKEIQTSEQEEVVYTPIMITKENVTALLLERITQDEIEPQILACVTKMLEEVR